MLISVALQAKEVQRLQETLTGFNCKEKAIKTFWMLISVAPQAKEVQRLQETWKNFVEQQRNSNHFTGEMLTQSDHGVRFIGSIQKRICDFRWILNYQTTEGLKKDLLPWKSHVVVLLVINKK